MESYETMTLQTLKDLKSEFEATNKDDEKPLEQWKINLMQEFLNENFIKKEDLRAEAIKWIKELSKPQELDLKFSVINHIKPFQKEYIERRLNENKKDIIIWIKHFFNITDEGLK